MKALGHRAGGIPAMAAVLLMATAPTALAGQPQASTGHLGPLDPLTGAEIRTAYRVLDRSGRLPDGVHFPNVLLREPPKQEVLAWKRGQPFRREAFLDVFDPPANRTYQAIVDLHAKKLLSWTEVPDVQPAVYYTEYDIVDRLVRADPRWQQAMRDRGIDPEDVYVDDGWGVGQLKLPGIDPKTRLLRALSFYRGDLPNPYDRPIEGVTVTLDMNHMKVVEMLDTGKVPVDMTTSGKPAPRPGGLKPLIVTQPQGPSFHLTGDAVSWLDWRFRIGYDERNGLILYQVGYDDGGTVRPIIYRMTLDEIYVPYGIPDPNWAWRGALDVGEYDLGQLAEPLRRGVDVPDNAVFLDQVAPDDNGTRVKEPAYALPHAVALYERDAPVLWDRMDPTTYERDTRRGRQLVVTSAYANGNYTYIVEYAFGMDGSIQVIASGTGTTLNQGTTSVGAGEEYGTAFTPTIAGPAHQHFFSFYIDFDVDGQQDRVVEEAQESRADPTGNAFVTTELPLTTEGPRDVDPASGRRWMVESATRLNALGNPTAYELMPGDVTQPFSGADFPPLQRAQYALHPLWVTRYHDGELHAAGDYPNQSPPGKGLPEYVANAEDTDGQDLVMWYTAGFTHSPEVEDYPMMAPDTVRFTLAPSGFFDHAPMAAP